MKFALVSDTHGYHREMEIPAADVLVHAGDFCSRGTLEELGEFAAWLREQPHQHKVVIAGNHDWPFEREPSVARAALGDGVIYLQDSGAVIDGVRFWGSPWQPWFLNWAFNVERGPKLAAIWAQIPEDTDVLVTHGPPAGILDRLYDGTPAGCSDLMARLETVRPRLHVFGHIHEAYGRLERDGTTFVNASSDYGSNPAMLVQI